MLGGKGTWTALAVGVAMLVVVPATTAQAATCPFAGTVRTWTGATDSNWHNGANWTPAGIPDATTLVCIPDASAVDMGGVQQVVVPAFWVGDATLELHDGAGLFAMSHTTESAVEAGGSVDVTSGFLGGEGVLRVKGRRLRPRARPPTPLPWPAPRRHRRPSPGRSSSRPRVSCRSPRWA